MASQTKGALGVQKQFSPQPRPVYEKQLRGLPAQTQIDIHLDDNTKSLANALGVLETNINAGYTKHEERKKKIGIAEAERKAAGLTKEDWETRTAVEILSNYGDLSDSANPYGVVTVEKMRGKFFSSQRRLGYAQYKEDNKINPQTIDEELKVYSDYMREGFDDSSEIISDIGAFRKGYFDTFTVEQTEVAKNWQVNKDEEMRMWRVGSTRSSLKEKVDATRGLPIEERIAAIQPILNDALISTAKRQEMVEYAQYLSELLVYPDGDFNQAQKILDRLVIGTHKDENVSASIGVDLAYISKKGAIIRSQYMTQEKYEYFKTLAEKSVPEIIQASTEMRMTDPEKWSEYESSFKGLLNTKQNEEAKRNKENLKRQKAQALEQMAFNRLDADLDAHFKDWEKGYDGIGIGHYTLEYADEDGIRQTKAITEGQKEEKFRSALGEIENDQNLSEEEKIKKIFKLYEWKAASPMQTAFRDNVIGALNRIDVTNPSISDNVQRALEYQKFDPDNFRRMFGDTASNQLNALRYLSSLPGETEGARLFALGRDELADSATREIANAAINKEFTIGASVRGFKNLSGHDVKLNMGMMENKDIERVVRETALYLYASGTIADAKLAVQEAQKMAQASLYVFRDIAVPKSILPEGFRNWVGQEALDTMVNYYGDQQEPKVEPSALSIDYDIENEKLIVWARGCAPKDYTLNNIKWQCNETAKKYQKNAEAENVTVEEYIQRKETQVRSVYDHSLPNSPIENPNDVRKRFGW